jgi:hypothetical protein
MQGLRATLLRCYGSLPPSALTLCPQQPQAWPRLLFALAFFHALVLERRKYGSLGWNTKYDFSDGDWLCARHTLSMFLNTPVSFTTYHHLPSKAASKIPKVRDHQMHRMCCVPLHTVTMVRVVMSLAA